MIKKLTAIALGASLISATTIALAGDEKLDVTQEGTQTVVLSGCLGEENANLGITAQVYAQGFDFSDLRELPEGKTIFDVIKFHDETVTDSEGNYEFKFDLTTESQWITPFVSTENIKVGGTEYDYMFVNDTEWRGIADKINDAANSDSKSDDSDVLDCLDESFLVLGFSESELKGIDKAELAKVILNTVKDENLNLDDRDASWLLLKQALMVERLNENKIDDIYEEPSEYTNFEDTDIKDWYNKEFITDKFKADFTDRLSDSDFESYNDYKKALAEAFVLSTVRYPNGIDNIKDIFNDFEEEIDVKVNDAENHVWSSLSGEDYDSFEDLADGFYDLNENPPKTTTGGGGKGGNGKGSVSSYSGNIYDMTNNSTSATPINKEIFDDLGEASWAKDAIVYLAEQQIVGGVGNNKFAPNANVTREQFAKIVVGAFTTDAESKTTAFADVDSNSWYAPFIEKAYSAGIVNGISTDMFGVGKNITRQDMCVMIYRAATASGMEIKASDYAEFADDSSISDYAKEAVYSLRECGAVNGITDTEFAPNENATRAQAAKIIYYLIKEM